MNFIEVADDSLIPELIAEHKLDRRVKYFSVSGQLCRAGKATMPCTGCNEFGEMGGRHYNYGGCRECGYTGKRVNVFPIFITKED